MSGWDKAVEATAGHRLERVDVRMRAEEMGENWVWLRCSCGESEDDDFVQPSEFTDHIRQIVCRALGVEADGTQR